LRAGLPPLSRFERRPGISLAGRARRLHARRIGHGAPFELRDYRRDRRLLYEIFPRSARRMPRGLALMRDGSGSR
jgi:hypothetical protein